MKLNFKHKALVTSVSSLLTLGVIASLPVAHASDIEIYKLPDKQQKTIMMMLDTSGSMSVYPAGPSACDIPAGVNYTGPQHGNEGWLVNTENGIADATQQTANSFHGRWCAVGTTRYYDRMTKLKSALVDTVKSTKLDDSVYMGVGTFAPPKSQIIIPARPLTAEQRNLIFNTIRSAAFGGSGATPSANAYAEVAAYLLGTTTVVAPVTIPERVVTPEQIIPPQTIPAKPLNKIYRYASGEGESMWHCALKDSTVQAGNGRWSTSNLRIDDNGYCETIAGSPQQSNRARLQADGFVLEACPNRVGNSTNTMCAYKPDETYTIPSRTIPGRTIPAVIEPAKTIDMSKYYGFDISNAMTKNGSNYISPLPKVAGTECSGQAIYFLTDGYPNEAPYPQALMQKALGSAGATFPMSGYTGLGNGSGESGWGQIGEFSKWMRDKTKNPAGVEIPTAVVGFGGEFAVFENASKDPNISSDVVVNKAKSDGTIKQKVEHHYNCSVITNEHARNSCNWGAKTSSKYSGIGGYGEGGFYYAKDGNDVVNSILSVVDDIEVEENNVVTGSPSIPLDSLNPRRFLPFAYYATFNPRPDSQQQLWVGNINKFRVVKSEMVDRDLDNVSLLDDSGKLNDRARGLWGSSNRGGIAGGVTEKLRLRLITNQENKQDFARKVLTNREIKSENNTVVAANTGELKRIQLDDLYGGSLANDPKKNYWLNVLGFQVGETTPVARDQLASQPELRQLGATLHSSPLLFTQSAVFNEDGTNVKTREDYVLFGTTDGIIHVVDDKDGIEKFAFVPNEMMEKQPQAFLTEASTGAGGRNNLFYGSDAPWVIHTQYAESVVNGETRLTVRDSTRNQGEDKSGWAMQWAYGGLRMGGKSYYALDLSDINNPTLKFHIDPENGKVYSGKNVKEYPELKTMGQSWSKPVLGYVNWKGKRKLVMFVGGGYDIGYEATDYRQTNGQGAGVYMFDADNGDLLWWAGSALTTPTANVSNLRSADLKYSVVSRINTIDRNGDGLIDHLYFGDLGGQAFRIDLNNQAVDYLQFGVRVTKLFDEHKADGTSPRFYEMPSVSVHIEPTARQGDGNRFAVVAFSSGDRSSPYTAGRSVDSLGNETIRPTAQDGVFVYYDNDIAKPALLSTNYVPVRLTQELTRFQLEDDGVPQRVNNDLYNRGWKYLQVGEAGRYKGVGEPFAMSNLLFVNVYDKIDDRRDERCGGGVRGDSYVQQYCLPTGKCLEDVHGFTVGYKMGSVPREPSSSKVGVGLVGTSSGTGYTSDEHISNVTGNRKKPTPSECTLPENKSNPLCAQSIATVDLKNLRWFESK